MKLPEPESELFYCGELRTGAAPRPIALAQAGIKNGSGGHGDIWYGWGPARDGTHRNLPYNRLEMLEPIEHVEREVKVRRTGRFPGSGRCYAFQQFGRLRF
jgi:hypothetical protein